MISIKFFSGLPLEYESFLIEKYDSFITTCRYIEVNYPDYDVNYSTVNDDGELIDLLVYGNRGNTAKCFNSLTSIDQSVIYEFTKKLFVKHPEITKIEIEASYKEYSLNRSFLSFKSDDQILELPSTLEEYFAELGYHTRKNIKARKVKFLKNYPNAKFVTKYGSELEESIVEEIILLNSFRMKSKGIVPGIDNTFKDNIYKYSTSYGCVAYIEIDNKIVAGCISTMLNKRIFAHVIGHDNNYSKFNLGEMCFMYLIETSIERGMSAFHFLWGETEYKKRLLAKPNLLYSYYIYRSYSLDYLYNRFRTKILNANVWIQKLAIVKPVKETIKFYRKKRFTGKFISKCLF